MVDTSLLCAPYNPSHNDDVCLGRTESIVDPLPDYVTRQTAIRKSLAVVGTLRAVQIEQITLDWQGAAYSP